MFQCLPEWQGPPEAEPVGGQFPPRGPVRRVPGVVGAERQRLSMKFSRLGAIM